MTRREIRLRDAAEPISHYTDAVLAGGTLYVSGIVPVDAAGQVRRRRRRRRPGAAVFAIMGRVLAAAGMGPNDVARVTLYLLDVDDRPRINPVREAFFGATRPASTLVEVSRLAVPGALLEVEAIAHRGLMPEPTASEIAADVRAGRRSAEEVVRESLARLAAHSDLHAVITLCEERALARARNVRDGPLAGVPLLVKDLIHTAGVRTTYASAIYARPRPAAHRARGRHARGGRCDRRRQGQRRRVRVGRLRH